MKDQRGFIQIPLLIAILIGTVVIGGGAYVVTKEISQPPLVAVGDTEATIAPVATTTVETVASTTSAVERQKDPEKPKVEKKVAEIKQPPSAVAVDFKQDSEANGSGKSIVVAASNSPAPIPVQSVPDNTVHNPSVDAIDVLLANLTVWRFRDFCEQAKNLPGVGSHEGLNESKNAVIQIQDSLYTNILPCETVLGRNAKGKSAEPPYESLSDRKYPFAWFSYSGAYLLDLSSGDSDDVRIWKIKYNEKIKSLAGQKLIYFSCSCGLIPSGADHIVEKRPDDTAKMLLNKTSIGAPGPRNEFNRFLDSFVSIEEMLIGLKNQLRAQ